MTALLEVDHVSKQFGVGGLLSRRRVDAVSDVSFAITAEVPDIFTIIGESGSGKTTLARMILGLEKPSSGEIRYAGKVVSGTGSRAERLEFMAAVQPVFQNPFEAFNPLKRVDRYLASTARRFLGTADDAATDKAMDEALQKVGLSLAEVRGRYPHELSGGQLQRAAIARALICKPSLLITDEPVSMVDASLRMSIVNLLKSLRDELGVSVIYITHDLATAYYIADRILIMQQGCAVEIGPARVILDAPKHPYARLLKASVLSAADAGQGKLMPATELMRECEELLKRDDAGRLVTQEDGRQVREYSAGSP
ncbi:MAG: ATP-binding cassette domain-containing protein [Cucumibacter sp.]